MRYSHGNWLARHVFSLQVTIYLVGLKAWGSVIYFPSRDKCNGTEIESKCEDNGKRGVRINDTRSLNKVLGNINDSKEYWTGLSWHHEWGYSWYLNKSLPTRVEENLTDINNTWFCFLVKKGETKLIAERCDESHYYICQDLQTVQPRNVYTGGQPRKRKKRRKKREATGTEVCQSGTCINCCQDDSPCECEGTQVCHSGTCINCCKDDSPCYCEVLVSSETTSVTPTKETSTTITPTSMLLASTETSLTTSMTGTEGISTSNAEFSTPSTSPKTEQTDNIASSKYTSLRISVTETEGRSTNNARFSTPSTSPKTEQTDNIASSKYTSLRISVTGTEGISTSNAEFSTPSTSPKTEQTDNIASSKYTSLRISVTETEGRSTNNARFSTPSTSPKTEQTDNIASSKYTSLRISVTETEGRSTNNARFSTPSTSPKTEQTDNIASSKYTSLRISVTETEGRSTNNARFSTPSTSPKTEQTDNIASSKYTSLRISVTETEGRSTNNARFSTPSTSPKTEQTDNIASSKYTSLRTSVTETEGISTSNARFSTPSTSPKTKQTDNIASSKYTLLRTSVTETEGRSTNNGFSTSLTRSIATTTSGASSENSTHQPNQDASKKLNRLVKNIEALNPTKNGSLRVGVKALTTFLKELRDLDRDERRNVNVLLASQALETFAFKYATIHLKENESAVISEETYAMKIHKVATNNKDELLFSVKETTNFSTEEDWTSITLPSGVLKGNGSVVVFTVYDNISELVPDTEQTGLDGKKFPKLNLRSRIIAATVDPPPDSTLQENATISFSFNKESDEKETPHCVFWNFTVKSEVNGSWSKKGCSLVKTQDDNISCACNHLTNFAVLMQVGESEVPSEHRLALEVITYVGCTLSLFGEILTIIAYCTLTNFKEEQIQIRLNLVIALAIAQIAFLSGINAVEPKGLCVFIAAFTHYFYLVGFAWMLFEGVYLYLKVVKVFNTEVRMRLFLAVAWGVPAGIVALSIAFASGQDGGIHSYVNGAFCWVSVKNQIIWTFVAPVLVICVINMVLLSLVIHEILKMQSNKKSDVERLGQSVKTCVVLFPLLGLTWVFGVLSVTNASLVFQYIFTILNSLQGFFIFVLHVLRSTDVRAEFKRKTQRWMMNGLSSNRVADWPQSTNAWTNNAVNSDVHEFNEKPKTTSPSATTSRYHSPIEARQHGAFTPVDT
ncbi:adhesion G protein-coupled receptor L3-like isoform X2 [Montipora foliosa]|uniref:adhesion G protein-coupled receptor L3-like isoform X2 n=1 Tax=Montipora foliosa TaxID=591990 RepID=UPI0035F12D68